MALRRQLVRLRAQVRCNARQLLRPRTSAGALLGRRSRQRWRLRQKTSMARGPRGQRRAIRNLHSRLLSRTSGGRNCPLIGVSVEASQSRVFLPRLTRRGARMLMCLAPCLRLHHRSGLGGPSRRRRLARRRGLHAGPVLAAEAKASIPWTSANSERAKRPSRRLQYGRVCDSYPLATRVITRVLRWWLSRLCRRQPPS